MPKIFYFCPKPKAPSGGVRVIYRHVDLLNRAGFEVFIVHLGVWKKYRYPWVETKNIPIVYVRHIKNLKIGKNDFFVFPELWGPKMFEGAPPCCKVIFNQGAYYTF